MYCLYNIKIAKETLITMEKNSNVEYIDLLSSFH